MAQPKSETPQDIEIQVQCTLEEFHCGTNKTVSYEFDEVSHDSKTIVRKTKSKLVQVKPGYSCDTVLTFKGEGDQRPKVASSNVVIRFCEVPHGKFRRNGNDLIYTQSLSF